MVADQWDRAVATRCGERLSHATRYKHDDLRPFLYQTDDYGRPGG
jgi:hypothetical protein